MTQIRIHGRGGQGVVTASELIAIAAFEDGLYSQAFPSFGVERTGSPIEAYTRIDKKPIKLREHIYNPDILIVLDASLLHVINVAHGCDEETSIVVNTAKDKKDLGLKLPPENIYTIDATKIALNIIGKDIANTTILGAFAHNTGEISLEGLKKAVAQKFQEKGKKIIDKNTKAVERSYNS